MNINQYRLIGEDGATEAGGNPTVVLMVSLYLMLFAFFVVLNVISNEDQARVDAVLGSVHATFKSQGGDGREFSDLLAASDLVVGNDVYLDEVSRIFERLLSIPGYHASRSGDVLRVSLTARYLFYDFSPRLRHERDGLIDDLAGAIAASPQGLRNEIQLALESGPDLPGRDDLASNLLIMRAGSFATELDNRGAAEASIVTGLVAGGAEMVHLTFLTRAGNGAAAPGPGD